mmetsp:Transcript_5865/g.20579  ORF Transcript_5865/g.20579 Transcript_5865/m.20579 type:complete len:86 (+) Transcript_5865:796-1053(+)
MSLAVGPRVPTITNGYKDFSKFIKMQQGLVVLSSKDTLVVASRLGTLHRARRITLTAFADTLLPMSVFVRWLARALGVTLKGAKA